MQDANEAPAMAAGVETRVWSLTDIAALLDQPSRTVTPQSN